MAVLGLTKLQAVNSVLRGVNELPVTALDPGGTSIQARAEEVLDRKTSEVLSRGFQENTILSKSHTPVLGGGTYKIQITDGLSVKAAGSDQHRNLTLRGDYVYDLDRGTNDFLSVTPVFLDVSYVVTFEDISPNTKELITAEAATVFQQYQRGSLAQDQFRKEAQLKPDAAAVRVVPRAGQQVPSSRVGPGVASLGQPGGQQGGQ